MAPREGTVPPENDLILPRVAGGEPGAVEACIDRYGGLVWSLVRRSIRDHARMEDAVQEIFLSLWKAAGKYDPARGSEALYIATIARRRIIDRLRSWRRGPELEPLEGVVVGESDAGLARVDERDEAERAREALERIKPEQRRLLELWYLHGMTHSEIATSTGVPLGTVKSQIRRGLLRVRELLESHAPDAPAEVSA